ncbi:MAG: hypothetical protein PHH37_06850 [Paludibacter sp.]|nr:hypothetical protein [Paludibacter sp.]
MKKINNHISFILLFFTAFVFSSCNDEIDSDLFTGLWVQQSITEDGQEVSLSEKEKNLELLIESNGVYRTHTNNDDGSGSTEYYGAWTVTDSKWIEFSVNTWTLESDAYTLSESDQWNENHVLTRFTILSVDADMMQIRIKTYVGNKKYSPLFVVHDRPLVTEDNYSQITNEYKELKTYIFTFVKQQ